MFDSFKRFSFDTTLPMQDLLQQIYRASHVYRSFTESATPAGPIDRIGLFAYRTGVLQSEVIKPLILCLLDPEAEPVAPEQLAKALDSVESWMVRRMLVRATTKNYNQLIAELISQLRGGPRATAGDVTATFLRNQTSAVDIGRTIPKSVVNLRLCRRTAGLGERGCAWCWRRLRIIYEAGVAGQWA